MKLACVYAIAELAHAEPSELVARAYGSAELGVRARVHHPEAVRRPRLIVKIAPAVGACGDGVAASARRARSRTSMRMSAN